VASSFKAILILIIVGTHKLNRRITAMPINDPPVISHSESVSLLRLPEVMRRTGLSRGTIYAKMARGEFPASIDLGARSVAWLSDEVSDFIMERIRRSRASTQPPSRKMPTAMRKPRKARAASASAA
jgi:prophage regulatory protein